MAALVTQFYEHPEYKENALNWQKYQDLVEGKQLVLVGNPSYFWYHELEKDRVGGSELRAIRATRSRYLNLLDPIISRWISFFFKQDPDISEVEDLFEEEGLADVDGKGTSLIDFIKYQVAKHYFLFGKTMILTDSPATGARNREEERSLGIRPTWEMLSPLEVKDWQYSSTPGLLGQLALLRTEYQLLGTRTGLTEEPKLVDYCKVLSLVDGVYQLDLYRTEDKRDGTKSNWVLEASTLIPALEEIPVAIMNSDSWIKDASEQQLQLFNLMSAWSMQLHSQAVQRLVMAGPLDDKQKIAISQYTVAFVPEGTTVTTIESANTQPLENGIMLTIDHLFKVAFNQIHSLRGDSKEAPGAESQRESKEDFINLAKACLGELESLVNRAVKHYAAFKGQPEFEGKIRFGKDMTLEDVDELLSIYQSFKDDFGQIPELKKAILKKFAGKLNLLEKSELDVLIDETQFSNGFPRTNANGAQSTLLGERLRLLNGSTDQTIT